MKARNRQGETENGGFSEAEGFVDSSRGLSEATPPDSGGKRRPIPEGSQKPWLCDMTPGPSGVPPGCGGVRLVPVVSSLRSSTTGYCL